MKRFDTKTPSHALDQDLGLFDSLVIMINWMKITLTHGTSPNPSLSPYFRDYFGEQN